MKGGDSIKTVNTRYIFKRQPNSYDNLIVVLEDSTLCFSGKVLENCWEVEGDELKALMKQNNTVIFNLNN